jgi:hypothetical protein
VKALRDECQCVGVPFYFKQAGGVRPDRVPPELDGRSWREMPSIATDRSGEPCPQGTRRDVDRRVPSAPIARPMLPLA